MEDEATEIIVISRTKVEVKNVEYKCDSLQPVARCFVRLSVRLHVRASATQLRFDGSLCLCSCCCWMNSRMYVKFEDELRFDRLADLVLVDKQFDIQSQL